MPFLTGCAGLFSRDTITRSQQFEAGASLAAARHWQAEGKLGVRWGIQAESAFFQWRQQGDDFEIVLHGPLGQGRVVIEKQRGVFILHSKQEVRRSQSAEQLMQALLGWSVPLHHFEHWIKGVPSPGLPLESQRYMPSNKSDNDLVEAANTGDILANLSQEQWRLTYTKQSLVQGYAVPHKIVARHDPKARANGVKLVIAVSDWNFD